MSQRKFKQERYIIQSFSDRTKLWSFYVSIRKDNLNIRKAFSEKDYGSARNAFDNAVAFRDITLNDLKTDYFVGEVNKTVYDVIIESYKLFPVSAETKRKYDIYFNKFPNVNIQDISTEIIQAHLVNYIYNSTDEKIQRIFSIWKRIIKTAIAKNYISRDYTIGVIVPKSKKIARAKKLRVRSKDNFLQAMKILENIDTYESKTIQDILWTLYYTGMRPAECVALLKSDLDFENEVIYVNKQMGSDEDSFGVIMATKTKMSNRIVPMAKTLQNRLKKRLKNQNGDIVFPNSSGLYFETKKITHYLHETLKNKVDFHMYDLRHLFSTDLINSGVDPKTHQELMGHSTYRMSVYYADSEIERKRKAIESR